MTIPGQLLAVMVLLAAGAPNHVDILEQVLVKVNGDIITKTDLEQRQIAALRQRNPDLRPNSDAELQQALAEITPTVILEAVDELLITQRGRELGYSMTNDQFTEILNNIKKENKLEDDAQFQAALQQEGLTLADLRRQLERTMIVQRVQQTEVMSRLQVTDAELKMYYDSHRESFTSNPQITLRELLVAVAPSEQGVNVGLEEEASARANDIRKRLLAGEPFARLAAELSDSPSKANGGLVGPLTADVLAPELQQALLPLKPGELTPVLRTARGFQIIKLETKDAVTVRSFEEARSDISQRLSNEKRRAEFTRFLDRLRGQALIDWKNADLKKAYELGLKNAAAELAASAVP